MALNEEKLKEIDAWIERVKLVDQQPGTAIPHLIEAVHHVMALTSEVIRLRAALTAIAKEEVIVESWNDGEDEDGNPIIDTIEGSSVAAKIAMDVLDGEEIKSEHLDALNENAW